MSASEHRQTSKTPITPKVINDDPVRLMDPETKKYVYVSREAGRMIKRHGFIPGWREHIIKEPTVPVSKP